MDVAILEDLGLTQAEIKVYVALLELGSSSAGPIVEKSTLQNSVVHRALHTLIDKGLISYVLEGRRKLYQATDPEYFYSFIESKKQNFSNILPELKAKQSLAQTEESATVYKGVRGIHEVYSKMISLKGEYNTFGGGMACADRMSLAWWNNVHTRRIANKLPSRQVFDESVRSKDAHIAKLSKIKYLDKEFAQFQETVIVGDYVAIAVFSEKPYAFLMHDVEVAKGYRKYFELLWKVALK
jgi:sugar-specific transcriptional regulator TrmB